MIWNSVVLRQYLCIISLALITGLVPHYSILLRLTALMDISMQVNQAQVPVKVVRLPGPALNAANALEIRDRLKQAIEESSTYLVIELSQVTMMDSMGLSTLLSAMRTCRKTGYQLALSNIQDQVRIILSITKLDMIFPVFESVSAAVESF